MENNKHSYIIIGDNNFWYDTINEETEYHARLRLNEVRKKIANGEYEDHIYPFDLYLFKASLVRSLTALPQKKKKGASFAENLRRNLELDKKEGGRKLVDYVG